MAKAEQYIEINTFKGVDFSNDDMAVDITRSPNAVNILADIAGRPELRPGIAKCGLFSGETEIAIIKAVSICRHDDHLIIVAENGIFAFLQTDTRRYELTHSFETDITKGACTFKMNDKTYICGSGLYKVFTPTAGFEDVEGYVPTTTIGRAPAGGGTVYESINMLTNKRINSFAGDGTAKEYWLDGEIETGTTPTATVDGETTTAFTASNASRKGFTGKYGKITFTNAPADGDGVDNVTVTYSAVRDAKETAKIKNCSIASSYGVGNDSRIFLSGNAEYPNTDWYSGLYDPTYFPDTGYTKVGDDAPIYGYLKQDGYQIIVKKAEEGESSLFLRSAELREVANISGEATETQTVFSVYEGIAGVGLAAKGATLHIHGDAMLLTREGLYGIESSDITKRTTAQHRSYYIARQLKKEDLTSAKTCAWGKYGVIAIGRHIYICDTEQTNSNPDGYIGYEWYYWELPVDIRCIADIDGTLTIGTDSAVYQLKSAEEGMNAYSDETAAGKLGIPAIWTTPILYGGDFMRYKTILKRGTGILAKPFVRGSGEILMTTNKVVNKSVGVYETDILDWNDIDFNRFTFNTRTEPRVKIYPKKHRKVMFFQMAVRHSAPDEGWGIAAMRIAFTLGNLTKKST